MDQACSINRDQCGSWLCSQETKLTLIAISSSSSLIFSVLVCSVRWLLPQISPLNSRTDMEWMHHTSIMRLRAPRVHSLKNCCAVHLRCAHCLVFFSAYVCYQFFFSASVWLFNFSEFRAVFRVQSGDTRTICSSLFFLSITTVNMNMHAYTKI